MQVSAVNFKQYHGCRRINRSDTRQLIDWERGEQCLEPTNTRCWIPTKEKYFHKKIYQTRHRERLNKEIKDMFEKDVKKAVYDTLAKVFDESLVLLDCKVVSIKDIPS